MNQCYEGDFIDNPYYMRQYGGDTPDFGPQDHSKKNNPLDQGLEYENFCLDPKPPVLDTPSPQIRQGAADTGLEPKLSFDLLDTDANMEFIAGSNDLNPFSNDSDFMMDGTIPPSENFLDSNDIASTGTLDFFGDDSSTQSNMGKIGFLANSESADPEENLFLDPGDEKSDSMFASLERRSSSSIRYDSEGDLAVRILPTLAVESERKTRRQLSACV